MTKNFAIAIVLGVLVLGIFVYFTFGFNQTGSQKLVPPTETTVAPNTDSQNQQLQVKDIEVGTGKEVKSGDTVVINYTGTLENGTKFDSSYDHGKPFETQIGVGKVIKGWDLGVVGMKVGGKRKLVIPPSLGYGDQAIGNIPPNSTLLFEVELMDVK